MPGIFHPISTRPPCRWQWLTLIGPDAKDFLHRLTTVNAKQLGPGEGSRGFFLTAQGKSRAYFTLWNYRETEYAFEYDGGDDLRFKQELLTAIDQYTFAEQMVLADLTAETPELDCRWLLLDEEDPGASGDPRVLRTEAIEGEEIRVCHHGSLDFGRPWISVWGRPARLSQYIDHAYPGARELTFSELEALRVAAVRPRVGIELTEATIPLEVGLVDAIAQNKGCYPGQEVIERIIALGAPARRLALVEGSGTAPQKGDKLFNEATPPVEVGEVTSVSEASGRFSALAIVRKLHAKEGLPVKLASGASARVTRIAPYA